MRHWHRLTLAQTPLWAFGVGEVIASKSDKLQTGT